MKKESFTYSFKTPETAPEVFKQLLNVRKWWSGLYEETITGKSRAVGDEFSFEAGGGAHYSKQKLVELVPENKMAWLVTDSRLNFLKNPKEWDGTLIRFDISSDGRHTKVNFTHEGLVPKIECFGECSGAWTNYLNNLKKDMKGL